MTRDVAAAVQRVFPRMLFPPKTVIFREGDAPDYAYIIISGSVHITKRTGDRLILLTTLGGNQMFGEMALFDTKPRSASAIAQQPTEVLLIKPQQFKAKMEGLDPFVTYLLDHLMGRVRDLSERLAER